MTQKDDETLGFLIGDIARMMRARFHHKAKRLGLTRAQWTTLNRVSHNEGIKLTQLAELMEVDVVTVSRLVEGLTASGWLKRKQDPHDRRAFHIYITRDATPLLEELNALGAETEREAFDGLREGSLNEFRASLKVVRRNLSDAIARRVLPPRPQKPRGVRRPTRRELAQAD